MSISFETSVSIAQLADLKFYLNKIVKIDNIEGYTLKLLYQLKSKYDKFLDDSEGIDPDFPGLNFRGNKGTKINLKGVNALSSRTDGEEDPLKDFK